MFLGASQVDVGRQLFEDIGKLLGVQGTEAHPILTGDSDPHAVIRLRDFSRQVIHGDVLLEGVLKVLICYP